MARLPNIEFVVEIPKDDQRRRAHLVTGWVPYVIAHLENRPGEWALVDAENANTSNVKRTCELLEVDVEVVMRNRQLYMRLNK